MPILSFVLGLIGLARPAPPPDMLAITDVAVLPMDRQAVLHHQTVLISGGRIIRLGDMSRVPVPKGAQVVDGRGKYLIPGLSDMHVHLTTAEELPIFVGYGVLTVRDLNGSPATLAWRQATAAGTQLGPRLIVSGPMLAGTEIPWRNKVTPATAADARAAVLAQKAAGYDLIKIYDGLSKEAFDAAIATAKSEGMLSTGHIPESVGFAGVLASGMNGLEHLDKTVQATVNHNFDTLMLPIIADSIRKSGMWVTPTLESMIQLAMVSSGRYDSLMARPEAMAAPADLREFWSTITVRIKGNRPAAPGMKYNSMTDYQLRLAGALNRAGVPLLAGTDLPNAVLVPGYSLHRELDVLVEAGLTRYRALVAATSNPARFMRQQDDWGSVAEGRRANLVLVDGDPTIDLATLHNPAGVVLAGRWIDRGTLAALRAGSATTVGK